MENFVKLQSTQGIFDVSGNKNLCDFQIPANSGSYDLSQSFININCKIETTSTDAVSGDANAPDPVYNVGLVINESARATNAFETLINCENAVLVKNARMLCSRGKVEDIRKVDCLRSNLALYKQSDDNQVRNTYGLANWTDNEFMPVQPLNSLVGEGNQDSQKRGHDIRIPLSSIFEMGKSTVWDTSYYGHTKLNLELNLDKLSVLDKTTAVLSDNRYLLRGATEKYTAFKDMTATGQTGTVGTADYALVSKIAYESIEDSPFYVGQRCDLVKGGGTGTLANSVVQIKKITQAVNTSKQPNDAGGALTHAGSIMIEFTVGTGVMTAGQTLTGLTLTPKDKTSAPITINNIELVAKMTDETESEPTQYTTYIAQEDSAPAGDSISRTYSLPPNTTNCYVMFNNPIYSSETLDTYRITMDGVDLTNRDIKVGSGLHYDLISQVFMNRGQAIGSLQEEMKNGAKYRGEGGEAESMVILMFPVKLNSGSTQLGLELNGTALSGKIIVYSEVVKEL